MKAGPGDEIFLNFSEKLLPSRQKGRDLPGPVRSKETEKWTKHPTVPVHFGRGKAARQAAGPKEMGAGRTAPKNQIPAQHLRSRRRLRRLTDAACPLRAERLRFGSEERQNECALTYKISRSKRPDACSDVVRLKGFEPPTFWFVAKHSIQLSYSRIL